MKRLAALVLAALMILGMTACGQKKDESKSKLDQIKEAGVLVVGTSADYSPFEFHTQVDGQDTIVGIDISICQYIADQLGVQLKVVDMNFDNLVMDELVAQAYVNADPSLAISPLRFDIGSDSGIRIGVQKGNDEFVTYLNQVIAEMQSQNLLDKYVSDAQALAGLEG